MFTLEDQYQAEQQLIGELSIDRDNRWLSCVTEDLIEDSGNRQLYELIVKWPDIRNDLLVFSQKCKLEGLKDKELLKQLFKCQELAATVDSIPSHIEHLKEIKRRIKILTAIGDIKDYPTEAQIKILNIATTPAIDSKIEIKAVNDLFKNYTDILDERMVMFKDGVPQATGYSNLDRFIGGIIPKCLYVIGARTSMGKSALMLNLAFRLAAKKIKTLFLSCEMPLEDLRDRLSSSMSGVESFTIKFGNLDKADLNNIFTGINENNLEENALSLCYKPKLSAMEIITIIERVNPQIVFLDHIQLISLGDHDNLAQAIGEVMYELKRIAGEKDIAMVVGSQQNRESEKSMSKNPKKELSPIYFKGSGSIEESADVCIEIDFSDGQMPDVSDWNIDLRITKNRYGRKGIIPMVFKRPTMTFIERIV